MTKLLFILLFLTMGCEIPIGIIILDRYSSLHQVVTSASIITQREESDLFSFNFEQSKKEYSPPLVYIPDFIMSRKAISETIKRVGTPPPKLLTSYLSGKDVSADPLKLERIFQDIITVESTVNTDIIRISISHDQKYAEDAALLINTHLDIVNQMITANGNKIKSKHKTFLQERIKKQKIIIDEIHNKIMVYTQHYIQGTPQTALELARMKRELAINEEIYLELQKEHEKIRIEETKNIGSFIILEEARYTFK